MSTFIKNSSPSLAKRIEREITNEAVKEDKQVQHALKELHHLEKADRKATKEAEKAEKTLTKAEHKEESTQHALSKAAKKHEDAVASIARREKELQASHVKEEKTHAALQNVKAQVEGAIREKDAHEKERLRRLEAASATSSYVEEGADAVNRSPQAAHPTGEALPAVGTIATEGAHPAPQPVDATRPVPPAPPRRLA